MGKRMEAITPVLQRFIEAQHLYFVGTAAADGRVNISPKGMDSLRVLSPTRVTWLNVTGSGNESAAHILQNPRMTVMFCAFTGAPMILRLYGSARMVQPGDPGWEGACALFPALPGARQVYTLDIDLVQTSCGMAVPFMDYLEDREALNDWAGAKSEAELDAYQAQKNAVSLDGFPTGLKVKMPG